MSFRLVRIGGRPLLAAPLANRTIRAASVGCYPGHTWKKRLVRSLIRAAVWSGLDRVVWRTSASPLAAIPPPVLQAWMEQVRRQLAGPQLHPVFVWPADATRGRVYVHWLDQEGRGKAFSKLGLDQRNSELIQNEQHALEQLAEMGIRRSRVPRVLASGRLQAFSHLTVEFAPKDARITQWERDAPIEENIREYAGEVRRMTFAELEVMPWWRQFTQNAGGDSLFVQRVHEAAKEGVQACRVHGDLNQTNVLRAAGQVWLLDWERSSEAGPCMTDAVCVEVDRLWPLTHRDTSAGLERFQRKHWNEHDSFYRCRVLLALAFLWSVDFPPAVALLKEWFSDG